MFQGSRIGLLIASAIAMTAQSHAVLGQAKLPGLRADGTPKTGMRGYVQSVRDGSVKVRRAAKKARNVRRNKLACRRRGH